MKFKKITSFSIRALCCVTLATAWAEDHIPKNEPILPIPLGNKTSLDSKESLGMRIFSDKRLSKNETVSCSSCHMFNRGGADGLAMSIGIDGLKGTVNAPTVFNSSLNFRQFWDGRAKTLEDQVDGPVRNPSEMGSTWEDVIAKLKKDASYVQAFKDAYGEPVRKELVQAAIAAFERRLLTVNSRFDRFLRGESTALKPDEFQGYQLFKSYGCISCHQGVNVGGNMFQTMGVMGNYFADRGGPITDSDLGRGKNSKNPADRFVFRVPSLRNVAETAPYFHDGSVVKLEEAIVKMARYQLGRELPKSDADRIAAFLRTLTGELPAFLKTAVAGTN